MMSHDELFQYDHDNRHRDKHDNQPNNQAYNSQTSVFAGDSLELGSDAKEKPSTMTHPQMVQGMPTSEPA